MENLHQEIVLLIKQYSPQKTSDRVGFGLKYVGTNKPSYHLNTKDTQTIAKLFLKSHALSLTDFHKLILSLYQGKTYDEINVGAKIIQFSTQHKKEIDLIIFDQ